MSEFGKDVVVNLNADRSLDEIAYQNVHPTISTAQVKKNSMFRLDITQHDEFVYTFDKLHQVSGFAVTLMAYVTDSTAVVVVRNERDSLLQAVIIHSLNGVCAS